MERYNWQYKWGTLRMHIEGGGVTIYVEACDSHHKGRKSKRPPIESTFNVSVQYRDQLGTTLRCGGVVAPGVEIHRLGERWRLEIRRRGGAFLSVPIDRWRHEIIQAVHTATREVPF